jgi:hypothetical protein
MQLACRFPSAAPKQSWCLTVVLCPLRARLGALGFGSPANLVGDHPVSQRRAVLVDQGRALPAVASPRRWAQAPTHVQ